VKSLRDPFVTVIMPVRNEFSAIGGSLRAIMSQDYPSEFMEVFVVDGQSTDGTQDIVNEIKKNTQIFSC
jgi:succinoglycan biosynthesis protein ExoA